MTSERDKLLFTPGPLNTSATVKEAMLSDVGSRDGVFIRIVEEIRERILQIAGVSKTRGFEAIPMQGSGSFGIEATISAIRPNDRLLVVVNGAYGRRIHQMAQRWQLDAHALVSREDEQPDLGQIERLLASSRGFTHIAAVHCETSSGILNPIDQIDQIGQVAKRHGCFFVVDAMSSFGGVPIDITRSHIDFLISSSNKCIQGVPGFSFVVARRSALLRGAETQRTVCLDLVEQWNGFESNGQFRFTPPIHAILAFRQALNELEEEGGIDGRAARYRKNHETLVRGVRRLGFHEYVPCQWQSWIITTFLYPSDPHFRFQEFYERLADKDLIIYPGKLADVDCFRIGTIGHIDDQDVEALLAAIPQALEDMKVALPDGRLHANGEQIK